MGIKAVAIPAVLARALTVLCLLTGTAGAGEVGLYLAPSVQLQYEGTGFRSSEGWELKVKPRTVAVGVRYRHDLKSSLALQAQYWGSLSSWESEEGSFGGEVLQTGQTKMDYNNVMIDLRSPLAGSALEAVAGAQGVIERFERKDLVFRGIPAADGSTRSEKLSGLGVYFGLHHARSPGTEDDRRGRGLYWDVEALLGHLLLTGNSREVQGGGITGDGFTYALRLEAGYQMGGWRFGGGYVRQLVHLQAPGGETLPNGAALSLPLNKTDFFGPILTVTYAF